MAENEGKQQTGRRTAARREAGEDPGEKEQAAAAAALAEAGNDDAPEAGNDNDDAPAAAEQSSDNFPKDTLIRRANELLGVSPALARGVLQSEGDELTIDQAKNAVQKYLDGEVKTEEG